jgi:D-glycero-D-manno-heptose 1,7-bisphosphate phosphatase
MAKIVFLDRDGIINQDSLHYIRSVDEFIPVEGSLEAIARLTAAGYQIGVATNQSGIARGYYTEKDLHEIHAKMLRLVRVAGGDIAAIEFCPHMPDSGCSCRKPQPGMLYKLAQRLQGSTVNTPFVGDRVSDVQAALSAGAQPVMVFSPMTDRAGFEVYTDVPVFTSLSAWVDCFLAKQT